MRILCLAADASRNALVRLVPIAKVLARHHDVEVVGFRSGPNLFGPYANEFSYRTALAQPLPRFVRQLSALASWAEADAIYAFKPLSTSLWSALTLRRRLGVPVVLDIEDWELGWYLDRSIADQLRHLVHVRRANGLAWTAFNELLVKRVDQVTVASSRLQGRFGGTFLPHGPNTAYFDPRRWSRDQALAELSLPDRRYILFAGSALPSKGIEDVLATLQRLRRPDVRMLLVGSFEHDKALGAYLTERYSEVLIRVDPRPHADMPLFLAVATAVVLAQRSERATQAQMPAKVYEAMAMGVPVIATRVSDLPTVLDGCGLLVPPGDPYALEEALVRLLDDETERRRLGAAGRERCIECYGWDAMERILQGVVASVVRG